MSVAAAWLAVNAQLILESHQTQLWQVTKAKGMHDLQARLSCAQTLQLDHQRWCRTSERLWWFSEVGDTHYVQLFELSEATTRENKGHHAWLGELLSVYTIDEFTLSTYSNQHTAATLIRGFRFRQAGRIVSVREIEHGRYHLQLRAPREDVLVIQQAHQPAIAPNTIAISMRSERD